MNSAQSKAKKRLKGLFSSNKGSEKDLNTQIKWDVNKTYSVMFHDKSKSEVIKINYLISEFSLIKLVRYNFKPRIFPRFARKRYYRTFLNKP